MRCQRSFPKRACSVQLTRRRCPLSELWFLLAGLQNKFGVEQGLLTCCREPFVEENLAAIPALKPRQTARFLPLPQPNQRSWNLALNLGCSESPYAQNNGMIPAQQSIQISLDPAAHLLTF